MNIRDFAGSMVKGLVQTTTICLCLGGGTLAAEEQALPSGFSLWTVNKDTNPLNLQSQSLLRPPSRNAFETQDNDLDMAVGIEHRFDNGLSVDLGVSMAQGTQFNPINYRDYFLGMRYGSLEGKVWYLPEVQDQDEPASLYYEAGWTQPVSDQLSFSLHLGQQQPLGNSLLGLQPSTEPNLSFGASANLRGYGLGLRLIDNGGRMFGGEDDLSIMGSISKPFP